MDKLLQQKVERMFIKKDCDRTSPVVQASIISAAAHMAQCTDIISYSDSLEVLLTAFGIDRDSEVYNLVEGMNSSYVREHIGYSVEFEDIARAMVNYQAAKNEYDEIYNYVAKLRSEQIQTEKQI